MAKGFSKGAGVGGFGFLGSVVAENAMRYAQPLHGATVEKVAAWYGTQRELIAVSEGLYATAIPCLLMFAVGCYQRARTVEAARPWAMVGMIGLCMMTPLFGAAMAFDIVLNANVGAQSASPELIHVLWNAKAAFFTLNVVALASGLGAMGVAFRIAGVGPRWLATVAALAAVPGIASALHPLSVVLGSPVGLLGFVTFVCWLLFLVSTSVGHLRAGSAPLAQAAGAPGAASALHRA
jgi:hypothetical protein